MGTYKHILQKNSKKSRYKIVIQTNIDYFCLLNSLKMGNIFLKIEVLEPHGKERLEELANLKLIKFVKTQSRKRKVATEPVQSREEILAGFAESVRDVKAAMRGEIQLRSIYDVLDEMEAEQKLENATP